MRQTAERHTSFLSKNYCVLQGFKARTIRLTKDVWRAQYSDGLRVKTYLQALI